MHELQNVLSGRNLFRPLVVLGAFLLAAIASAPLGAQPTPSPVPNQPAAPPEPPPQPNPGIVVEVDPEPRQTMTRRRTARSERVVIGNDVVVREAEELSELVVVFGDLVVDGTVGGSVVVIGGSVVVNGSIDDELVVIGGSAVIGPSARVGGEAVVIGGRLTDNSVGGIRGEQVELAFLEYLPPLGWLGEWFREGFLYGRLIVPGLAWTWLVAGLMLLLHVLVAVVFAAPVESCAETLRTRPGGSVLAGLLLVPLFPVLCLLLMMTGIGIFVVPLVLGATLVAAFFGKTAVQALIGRRLLAPLSSRDRLGLAVLVGGVLLGIFYAVPVLGLAVWGASALLGFGAVAWSVVLWSRRETERTASVRRVVSPPVEAAPATPPPQPIAAPEQPVAEETSLAGFGVRLGAILIDLLLIGLVAPLFQMAGHFLLLVALYNGIMVGWQQSTLGGRALGLRLVRLDGRKVDAGTAVIRTLAAFLSAAPLFLGFLWVIWDPEKQSWHDKIAGTTWVRVRRKSPAVVVHPSVAS